MKRVDIAAFAWITLTIKSLRETLLLLSGHILETTPKAPSL